MGGSGPGAHVEPLGLTSSFSWATDVTIVLWMMYDLLALPMSSVGQLLGEWQL